ncbi:DUF3800 domain-containing protein [Deferrisoma camini]|uniref:DUF3800 domain-containing protein n=1 Tax=Deferrisoma camini TaxID=1035120 RepID=UPI0009FD3C9A|nr:DUF3800 domain-containing protein [Deferrisoma camini]
MHICYVDESGDLSSLPAVAHHDRPCNLQPLLVIVGLILSLDRLRTITEHFIHLKRDFFPGRHENLDHFLDSNLVEVKGRYLRKAAASNSRREWRHAVGFIDKLFDLLEQCEAKIVGHIWVKWPGAEFDGRSTYTSAIQGICRSFDSFLAEYRDLGIMVLDSRDHNKDRIVSHSIFTQKFKSTGDSYPHIAEMPLFGRSNNHAGIQIADLIASAVVWPLAIHAYCDGHINNVHIRPNYSRLRERFGPRLKQLQYTYRDPEGRPRYALRISGDLRGQRRTALYEPPA